MNDKGRMNIHRFYSLKDSMQYGVLVDWFDSVGVVVDLYHGIWEDNFYVCVNKKQEEKTYITRPEARTKAIIQANKIYNELWNYKQKQ